MRLSNPIDPVQHPSEFVPGRFFELWERKWVPGKTSMEEYKAPFIKKDLRNYELNGILLYGGIIPIYRDIIPGKNYKHPGEHKGGKLDPFIRVHPVGIWFTFLLWNPEYKKSLEEKYTNIQGNTRMENSTCLARQSSASGLQFFSGIQSTRKAWRKIPR